MRRSEPVAFDFDLNRHHSDDPIDDALTYQIVKHHGILETYIVLIILS